MAVEELVLPGIVELDVSGYIANVVGDVVDDSHDGCHGLIGVLYLLPGELGDGAQVESSHLALDHLQVFIVCQLALAVISLRLLTETVEVLGLDG